jgi:hypothetical protein
MHQNKNMSDFQKQMVEKFLHIGVLISGSLLPRFCMSFHWGNFPETKKFQGSKVQN